MTEAELFEDISRRGEVLAARAKAQSVVLRARQQSGERVIGPWVPARTSAEVPDRVPAWRPKARRLA